MGGEQMDSCFSKWKSEQNETRAASFKIWTRVTDSISCNAKHAFFWGKKKKKKNGEPPPDAI